MTITSNATLSTLRPKNMAQLYANQTVYLLRKGKRQRINDLRTARSAPGVRNTGSESVFHLIWGIVHDWADAEYHFGETVALFVPSWRCWAEPRVFHQDERMNMKELAAIIGDGEVCMLGKVGKECPKHKTARHPA